MPNNLKQTMIDAREALEAATAGPWFRDGEGVCDGNNDGIAIEVMFREDLHLIVNAPAYIKVLLDGLKEQQREIDKLQSDFKALKETDAEILQAYTKIVNENHTSRTEHAAMKEALEWYGDEGNYKSKILDGYWAPQNPLDQDEGNRARAILFSLTKEESA